MKLSKWILESVYEYLFHKLNTELHSDVIYLSKPSLFYMWSPSTRSYASSGIIVCNFFTAKCSRSRCRSRRENTAVNIDFVDSVVHSRYVKQPHNKIYWFRVRTSVDIPVAGSFVVVPVNSTLNVSEVLSATAFKRFPLGSPGLTCRSRRRSDWIQHGRPPCI